MGPKARRTPHTAGRREARVKPGHNHGAEAVCATSYRELIWGNYFRCGFIPTIGSLQLREVIVPRAAGKTPLTLPGSHDPYGTRAAGSQVLSHRSSPGAQLCGRRLRRQRVSLSPRHSPVPPPQNSLMLPQDRVPEPLAIPLLFFDRIARFHRQ